MSKLIYKGLASFIANQNKSLIKDLSYLKGVMLNPIFFIYLTILRLTPTLYLGTKSLKHNSDISLTKDDKIRNVIINKSDYLRKAHFLSLDNSTYQKLGSDPDPGR